MTVLFNHNRDCATNTNVIQGAGLITNVKTIGERIKWARSTRGLTQAALAKKAGVSQSSIGNAESGTRDRPRELLSIARALEASPTWLETGKGEWQDEASNVVPLPKRRRIPVISWVQAGMFMDVYDNFSPGDADDWIETDTIPGDHAFALRVTGDSMTSPNVGQVSFPDGTVITVDPDRDSNAGDFVVAKDISTQKATFKQLVYDGGRWFLKPLNPSYPTVEIDDPSIRVIGRVTESQLRRKL